MPRERGHCVLASCTAVASSPDGHGALAVAVRRRAEPMETASRCVLDSSGTPTSLSSGAPSPCRARRRWVSQRARDLHSVGATLLKPSCGLARTQGASTAAAAAVCGRGDVVIAPEGCSAERRQLGAGTRTGAGLLRGTEASGRPASRSGGCAVVTGGGETASRPLLLLLPDGVEEVSQRDALLLHGSAVPLQIVAVDA